MSTTAPHNLESHERESYDCSHCGGDRDPRTSVAGSFCSTACHQAHRREKRAGAIMRELEQDHRFCATCGRQLKEVSKPPRQVVIPPSLHDSDWGNASDVLVGYQFRTPHAETGEISLDVRAGFKHGETVRAPVEDGVATGTICTCGATDHRDEAPSLRERFPFTTAHYLWLAARTLRAEDKHDVRLDRDRLFDAVLEQTVPVQEADGVDVREALAQAVILDG